MYSDPFFLGDFFASSGANLCAGLRTNGNAFLVENNFHDKTSVVAEANVDSGTPVLLPAGHILPWGSGHLARSGRLAERQLTLGAMEKIAAILICNRRIEVLLNIIPLPQVEF